MAAWLINMFLFALNGILLVGAINHYSAARRMSLEARGLCLRALARRR